MTGVLSVACGTLVFAQKPPAKGDQKLDPAAAAQQAQNQEIEAVIHAADAAMASTAGPACPSTPAPPANATAKCDNGDWSYSQDRSGTCSKNIGVSCWVCPGALCSVPSKDFPILLQTDFLKAQAGRVWVPLTITLDSSKLSTNAITLYLRVTPRGMTAPPAAPAPEPAAASGKDSKKKNDKNAKDAKAPAAPPPAASAYPYEDVAFPDLKPPAPGQPLRIQRGIGVPPGSYDLYVVMRERAPGGKLGVLKQPLDVPNYSTGDLTISTIILAERVDQLPAPIATDQQSEHPYAFGQTEIVVAPDRKFKKSQELIVLFQIYNPNVTPEKKFSLEATYTFYKQDAGAEKRFNSTEPQVFTSDTMGASFDPTGATSSIQAGQGIPLQSFPEGTYRLEIKITDKQSSKVLTQNTTFTVTP